MANPNATNDIETVTTPTFENSDIIICRYAEFVIPAVDNSTNATISGGFNCTDYNVNANGSLTVDPIQNLFNVNMEDNTTSVVEVPAVDENSTATNRTVGSYSVSFTRPLASDDANDANLTRNAQTIFWMYGQVMNNSLIIVRSTDQFGTAEINLAETPATPSESQTDGGAGGQQEPPAVEPVPSEPVNSGALSFATSAMTGAVALAALMIFQ
jgi:hypothetical protein